MSAYRAAGLSGCAPCRRCRHGHSASIPHAFAPAALRADACLQGIGARPIPAAHCLAPLQDRRTGAAGSARQSPRRMGRSAAVTPWLAAAGCTDACRPQCWRLSPITSRRTVHRHYARPRHGASTAHLSHCAAGYSGGVPIRRQGVALDGIRAQIGETAQRGCRAGPASFWSGSTRCVLESL